MGKPELISMKQHGTSVKLTLSILEVNKNSSALSEEFDIHNFAIVRFQILQSSYGKVGDIGIKKHELAKDVIITIKVSVEGNTAVKICASEDWSDWVRILGDTKLNVVEIDVTITVTNMLSIGKLLYADDTFTDFQLSAENGSVPVHKACLAANSDMFKTMLSGKWKETEEGRVELKGITWQALMYFKEYMYLGTFPDNDYDDTDTLCQLLLLAILYLINSLKLESMMKLIQKITAQNLNAVLEFAVENKLEELFNSIMEKTPEPIFASAFKIKMNALMY